jgi:predicted transcriptional regulator
LLSGPKTFEEIEKLILPKSVSRILKRLRSADLIETPKARDYIFFVTSKRDPNKETFTDNEREIYDAIGYAGISVGKLAEKTGLSIRKTYKYLRCFKGKKLVFIRRIPKTYDLTCKGKSLALVLKEIQQVVKETWKSSEQVMRDTSSKLSIGGLSGYAVLR